MMLSDGWIGVGADDVIHVPSSCWTSHWTRLRLETRKDCPCPGAMGVSSLERVVRRLVGLPWTNGRFKEIVKANEVAVHSDEAASGVDEDFDERSHLGTMGPRRMVLSGTQPYNALNDPMPPLYQFEGDLAAFSPGLGEDIWHMLTTEMSWTNVLVVEIVAEVTLIFVFSCLLCLAAILGDDAADLNGGELFLSKVLLAFSTVRISSDAIFGWTAREESGAGEVALVAILGWLHWLLLSVASALIVGRALSKQQQFVFAPDCTVGMNTWAGQRTLELTVRCAVLRPHYISVLQNIEMKLQMNVLGTGVNYPLKLKGGINGYPLQTTQMPLHFRHVIDLDSPIMQTGGPARILSVMASVSAEDEVGNRISQATVYNNPAGPTTKRFADNGYCPRRVLFGAKFADQFRFYEPKDADGNDEAGLNRRIVINLDTFHRVVKDKEAQAQLDHLFELQAAKAAEAAEAAEAAGAAEAPK